MKKIVIMLAVALIVSGAVWAQSISDAPDYGSVFPSLWVVPTESTEKRYSAGTFDSDVDNYLDPTAFDGQIGTFMFLGGFPGQNGNIGATDPLTNFNTGGSSTFGSWEDNDNDPDTPDVWVPNFDPPTKDTVSVGFAKSFGEKSYLGIYYGGTLVNAYGSQVTGNDANIKKTAESTAVWRNNLALLFGIGSTGFTLDLTMDNTESVTSKIDGKVVSQTVGNAPTVALGWGTNINDKLTPWVKVGFRFPDTVVTTNGASGGMIANPDYDAAKAAAANDPTDPNYDATYDPDTPEEILVPQKAPDKKATVSKGAAFGLNAGVWYGLNDTSSVLADLSVAVVLPDSYKGDTKDLLGTPGYVDATDPANPVDVPAVPGPDPYTKGGALGIDLYLKYTKALVFGENVTVKLKPNLGATFVSMSTKDSRISDKQPSYNWFTLGAGIDIGAEYRYDKIALYSGLGLRCFEWNTFGISGGNDKKNRPSEWTFEGLNWDSSRFGPNGSLGFGLTFTPIEGLVFGTGLNIGALFNPILMELTPNTSHTSTSAAQIWQNTALSITVSYKFSSKPKEDKVEDTQAGNGSVQQQDEGVAE